MTLLMVVSAIALAVFGLAAPGAANAGAGWRHFEMLAEQLELDEVTKGRVQGLLKQSREAAKAAKSSLRQERRKLRFLLDQDAPQERLVMRQADRLGRLKTELKKLRLRTMLRMRALLTPQQRDKLRKLRRARRRAMHAACDEDGKRWCREERGAGRRRCLMRQIEQLSPRCRQALIRRFRGN